MTNRLKESSLRGRARSPHRADPNFEFSLLRLTSSSSCPDLVRLDEDQHCDAGLDLAFLEQRVHAAETETKQMAEKLNVEVGRRIRAEELLEEVQHMADVAREDARLAHEALREETEKR